jgi:hypothetical protein
MQSTEVLLEYDVLGTEKLNKEMFILGRGSHKDQEVRWALLFVVEDRS